MPLWFVLVTVSIVVLATVIADLVFRRRTEREVRRFDGWEHWTTAQRLDVLREMKVETLIASARAWRIMVILLVLVASFVPTAMILLGQNADDTKRLAVENNKLAELAVANADDVGEALNAATEAVQNTEYENCITRNESRLYNIARKQQALAQAQLDLEEAENRPAFDIADIPGFDELEDSQVIEFAKGVGAVVEAGRQAEVERLRANEQLLQDDLDTYTEQFPILDCGPDPVPSLTGSLPPITLPD